MGVFSSFFEKNSGGLLSGLFGIGQSLLQNKFNKDEAAKNRDFQSDEAATNRMFQSNEAALQRNWSAAEAERARDWQEEQYAKYNSLSGKIAQAEQAGVNPMFAVTDSAVSPVSASSSAPSGASAGSVGTPSGSSAVASFVDIVGQFLGFKKMQSQINVDNALAEKYRAESERTTAETPYSVQKLMSEISALDERAQLYAGQLEEVLANSKVAVKSLDLTDKQIEHFDSLISKLQSETNTIDSIRDSEVRIKEAQAAISEFESSIADLTKDLSEGQQASINDFAAAFVKIFLAKFVGN